MTNPSSENYTEPLDLVTGNIAERIKKLSWKESVLFSACVIQRLIPLFDCYVEKHKLSDNLMVKNIINDIWLFLSDNHSLINFKYYLSQVEKITPYAEEYGSFESVLAQNFCIALNSTIQVCLQIEKNASLVSEFAFETLRTGVTFKETGLIDVGSSLDARKFLDALVTHPVIAKEIHCEEQDLSDIVSSSSFSSELVNKLRNRAENNHFEIKNIIP